MAEPLRFVGPDIPSAEDLRNCIHCGFCLPACPTYIATGHELESPRGRLHLIEAVRTGRVAASSQLLGHLDLCLQCRACETACPSAVPYGRIMEDARASIMANPARRQPKSWWLRRLVLRNVIAKPDQRSPAFLDTLAAGLAEEGKFDQAIEMQTEVIKMLREAGAAEDVMRQFIQHLDTYRSSLPLRDPPV